MASFARARRRARVRRGRLSFMRFLGLGLADSVPDAKSLWLYREALAKTGAVEELFDLFDAHLKDKGFSRRGLKSRAHPARI